MKNIIKPFIKYPILGNVILVALFLFGWVGFKSMKTTFFPLIPSKTIIISASYPGASPEEIEEAIVTKIEDNIKGLTGVERTTSTARENSCSINVRVLTGYDVNIILQDVKNAVDQISSFPVGMERITVYRQEPRNFAVNVVLAGDVDLKTLKYHARKIERDLLAVDGLSKVSLSGFPAEEIEIALRENDLRAYGLTFQEVVNAVKQANIKLTGGTIKGKREELLIRADVRGYYAKDLANHVLRATDDGVIIRLKDVASLSDRWSENPNRVYYNGEPAVQVTIQNTNQEDLFFVAKTVKDYINNFNDTHDDVQGYITRDGSEIIKERIDLLSQNGLLGIFLVVLFLSLSLNPRMSFWVALAIPISIAGMLMAGPAYGLTINVMSLLGMILVLGILVDDGIVIAENIYQHHERGEKAVPAAINGTVEVLPSVIASVLTTVVIFSTFFFLEGGLGDRTRDLAFVVVATLLISLVEAMFILPGHVAHSRALCSQSQKKSWIEKKANAVLFWMRDKVYAPSLKFSIKNPLIIIFSAVALYVITLGAMKGGIIRTTFFPYIEGRSVSIDLTMPAGTPVSVTDSLLQVIEERAWKINSMYKEETGEEIELIANMTRRVGSGTHQGSLRATLISSEKRQWTSQKAANFMRRAVGQIPGAEKLEFGGNRHWGKPVAIVLSSNDLDQLREAKEVLKGKLREVDKLKDILDTDPPGLREVSLSLKEKAFALGLTYSDVLSQVRMGFFGGQAQRLLRGIDEVKIWVRYELDDRSSLSKLENMMIRMPGGREYPLKEIADFWIERGVMSVNHIDGQRVVTVEADLEDTRASVPDILANIQADIMPEVTAQFPDVHFRFEGESYENQKTMDAIGRVVPPILILMFLIVAVTFRSFSQSIIVYLLIPFSIIGVLWGHLIQGYVVSMLSLFGAIALMGIVINDSLVFVSAMNQRLKTGMPFKEALYDAGVSRFRPVLLTSWTTIAGLGPLMFMKSHQAQFLSPMAISVAWGLAYGTLLTLVLLPAMLMSWNTIKVAGLGLIRKQKPTRESVEPAVKEEKFMHDQSNDDGC